MNFAITGVTKCAEACPEYVYVCRGPHLTLEFLGDGIVVASEVSIL
jgi:hypothetical protein